MNQDTPTALVTGANRGIGRAVATRLAAAGHHVIVASRDETRAAPVVDEIRAAGGTAEALALDVASAESIAGAARVAESRHRRLDVLVNNAGIMVGMEQTILDTSDAQLDLALAVNALGALHVTRALLPLLRASRAPRIVNVSSTIGAVSDMVDPSSPYSASEAAAYRLSKSALNGITGLLARALRADGFLVNAVCPGWVQTDMGGPSAVKTPAEAAEAIVALATLADDGPTGGFFSYGQQIPW